MKSKLLKLIALIFILAVTTTLVSADSVFPSTNDANRANGWAHVDVLKTEFGKVTLAFYNPRNFASCIEVRSDGDTSQKISDTNYNPEITDGLYPYFCMTKNSMAKPFMQNVMSKSAYLSVPKKMSALIGQDSMLFLFQYQLKKNLAYKDGWKELLREDGTEFKNQGDCVQYVAAEK